MQTFALNEEKIKGKPFFRRHRDALTAAVILAIPLGVWIIFSGYPMVWGLVLGFLEWGSLGEAPHFVWFDNFITFFTSEYYYMALVRTLYIGGLVFIIPTLLGLIGALLLNRVKCLKGLFRTLWYIPAVTSAVATSQIFKIFMDPYTGIVNNMITAGGGNPIFFDQEVGWSVFWIVLYSTWKGLGAQILLWLAALQSIDSSVVEAAEMDGASRAMIFFRISIPQMAPLIVFILINGFVGAMQVYEQVVFITNGGPAGQTEVLAYRIMYDAFWDHDFGMAGAASMIMLLITFFFSLVVFKRQKKESL